MKKTTLTNPHLTFKLGTELFAVNISKVITLLDVDMIVGYLFSNNSILGRININGYDLPIIDLRDKLGVKPLVKVHNSKVIVLKVGDKNKQFEVGVVVGAIEQIIEFEYTNIMSAPNNGSLYENGFIAGMAKNLDKFYLLLNTDKIFTEQDLSVIKEINAEEEFQCAMMN